MRPWLLTATWLLVATVSAQTLLEEGSGLGDDEDEDDVSVSVVPSRVVPRLRTPVPVLGPGQATREEEEEEEEVPHSSPDPIYLEEGSGYRELATPSLSQTVSYTPTPGVGIGSRSSTINTDRIRDSPPVLKRKLQKLAVTAGKFVRRLVPEDTFYDEEDGGTRNLRLTLRWTNGTIVANQNWIKFDQARQELFVLPVDENKIGRWKFHLTARDRSGQSVGDVLEIVVRQYSGSRLVNHYFEIAFSLLTTNERKRNNWEWQMIEKLRYLYNDRPKNFLVKRIVRGRPELTFGWTNSSLIQHSCPMEEIRRLHRVISSDPESGEPSKQLRRALGPEMSPTSARVHLLGACVQERQIPPAGLNTVPVVRNPLDRLNVTAGEVLRFRVPADTCFDREDGATPRLSLQLLTINSEDLSPRSWLKFDQRNQEFYGVPLLEDVGREEYQLVCSDRFGLSAIDGIEIVVFNRAFAERFGVEFRLSFQSDISGERVQLAETLPQFFGDNGPENVIVRSVEDNEHSLVWLNKSLARAPCNDPAIAWIRNRLLDPVSGRPAPALVRHLAMYELSNVEVRMRSTCAKTTPAPAEEDAGGGKDRVNDGDEGSNVFHGLIPSSEDLLTFLVPAVIIVGMLLLALLLACLLHQKRKAGKLNLFYSEALPPRVPVILQDELFDEGEALRRRQLAMLDPQEEDRLLSGPQVRPTPMYHRQQQQQQ